MQTTIKQKNQLQNSHFTEKPDVDFSQFPAITRDVRFYKYGHHVLTIKNQEENNEYNLYR